MSTTKTSLTEMEQIALRDLWESSKGNGHEFGYPDDLRSLAAKSCGGVMASLSKKGIIEIDYDDHVDYFCFTELGKSLFVDFHNSWTLANE